MIYNPHQRRLLGGVQGIHGKEGDFHHFLPKNLDGKRKAMSDKKRTSRSTKGAEMNNGKSGDSGTIRKDYEMKLQGFPGNKGGSKISRNLRRIPAEYSGRGTGGGGNQCHLVF